MTATIYARVHAGRAEEVYPAGLGVEELRPGDVVLDHGVYRVLYENGSMHGHLHRVVEAAIEQARDGQVPAGRRCPGCERLRTDLEQLHSERHRLANEVTALRFQQDHADQLREKLGPVLEFLFEPNTGEMWVEVEGMFDRASVRGKAKFLRDLRALYEEYRQQELQNEG